MRYLVCLIVTTGLAAADRAAAYKKAAGPHEVDTLLIDWQDAKRDRDVPVKLYFPRTAAGPFALIVFSHGHGRRSASASHFAASLSSSGSCA